MKMKVKNVLSSSTLPKTIIITSSTSLKNLNILNFKIWLFAIHLHMRLVRLQSCGGSMEELQSKVTKNDDCHPNKVASNKGGKHHFGCVILAWQ